MFFTYYKEIVHIISLGDTMPIILTLIAGLSTIIGFLPVIFLRKKTNNIINLSLSFAAGVMFSVSIIELLPESIKLVCNNNYLIIIVTTSLLLGNLFARSISKILPNNTNKLYKLGIFASMAIILHNIPEGMATFISSTHDLHLGVFLTVAISLHNIPEGICIAMPIYYATNSKKTAFKHTLVSSLSEPIGGLLAYLILKPFINNIIMSILLSFIAGLMIYISLFELLPSALAYNKKNYTIGYFIIGFFFIILIHYII